MAIDLSFDALFAQANGQPYAVTNPFNGPDLVNGGIHAAVDVGNFGMNDPILSPITGHATGLRHFDGALGIDYEIGDGWHVQLWHLNATLQPFGTRVAVQRRQVCGRTGNTGPLVNGQPMPAHTHCELEKDGKRYDIEPYLLGRPFVTGGDDMQIPKALKHIAQGVVAAGNVLRSDPATRVGAKVLTETIFVQIYGTGVVGESYTLGGKTGNTYAWIGAYGETWYVAVPLLTDVQLTTIGKVLIPVSGGLTEAQAKEREKAAAGKVKAAASAAAAMYGA